MREEINAKTAYVMTNDEETIPGDPPVYYTQVWLNETFGYHPKWTVLAEDGITGWGTINGLIKALQIYLGVGADGDFGNGTRDAFKSRYSSTNGVFWPAMNTTDNIYGIIEGALWCKGYYGSSSREIDCKLDDRGARSIMQLKADAGLDSSNISISALLMKALLSMDQFVLLSNYGGTNAIRDIQRYLNANYQSYLGIIPCDGLYQREMNKALIKVLQIVEGFSGSDVDGVFGNGTKQRLPRLSSGSTATDAIRLFHFCLTCNGYPISGTTWLPETTNKVRAFQAKHVISSTGIGDTNTWMALLLSKGNPDRSALGCDCATILNSEKAAALYNAGYRYVGRYVSGGVGSGATATSKALTRAEMTAIFNAGLRIFAIYQEGGVYLERYTRETGIADAEKAIAAATELGIPSREYIYFAVDYDVMDGYIPDYIVPYFESINSVMSAHDNKYNIGIYGARNVCSRICSEFGLASSCFISDMSTGYSGNMGYQLPRNWAFDQFHEFVFSSGNISFPLDKDAVSGRYYGFNTFEEAQQGPDNATDEEMLDAAYDMLQRIKTVFPNYQLGSRVDFAWSEDVLSFEIVPGVRLKVSYAHSKLFNLSGDQATYVTYKINNGTAVGMDFTETDSLYESLDASIKTEVGNQGVSLVTSLSSAIGDNGRISLGTKASNANKMSFYVVAEKYLRLSEIIRNSVSIKIEIEMEDQNNSSNIQESIEEFLNENGKELAITLACIAVAAVFLLAPEIVAPVAIFFSNLSGWLAAV